MQLWRWPLNIVRGAGFLVTGVLGLYRPEPTYVLSALVGLDQFGNALTGGDPRETISSRSAKARNEGKPWGCVMCRFLGWCATRINGVPTDHCTLALEKQYGQDAVIPD